MSIIYELHKPPGGKNHLNPRSEDIFTANVFGLLKLLPPRLWLLRILQRTYYGERGFVKLPYSQFAITFWRKLDHPPFRKGLSEIDIFVEVPPIIILIECKLLSPIGKGQILRYLDLAAYHYYSQSCQNVYFLLITKDQREPHELTRYRDPKEIEPKLTKIRPHADYKRVSAALAQNIGWISWADILEIIDGLPRASLPYSERQIIEELIHYMNYKLSSEGSIVAQRQEIARDYRNTEDLELIKSGQRKKGGDYT